MIDFGKYDRKIKFINLGTVSDGSGGFIPTPTIQLETFARVEQMKGNNNLEQAQLGLPQTYKVGVQFRDGFFPNVSQIIQYDGYDHKILSVEVKNERMRKEFIITMVRNVN